MTARYQRLRRAGFAPHVALALAEAGYDVAFVPVEQLLGGAS
jgi:hypothetical protein